MQLAPPTNSVAHPRYAQSAQLSSFARIEHGRSIDEFADIVVYDVTIPTLETVNGTKEVLCALTYAPAYDEMPLDPGIYRITAKVRSLAYDHTHPP